MQKAYKRQSFSKDKNWSDIAGAHCGYIILLPSYNNTEIISPETGTVFLCYERCGAGIVSHEMLHAVLWAWRHHDLDTEKYPISINSMEDEEDIAYMLTHTVAQFYKWLYKIEKVFQD